METDTNIDKPILYIKHMVCSICIRIVRKKMEQLKLPFLEIQLGRIYLERKLEEPELQQVEAMLKEHGFELLVPNKFKVTEQIKGLIHDVLYQQEGPKNIKFSEYLARSIGRDYSFLSQTFSKAEKMTIEKYIILQKVIPQLLVKFNGVLKFLSLAGVLLFAGGCNEEEDGLQTQPHDQNKMMTIMHTMMDEMEAMPMNSEPDIDFAKMMIMHHQGAINMATEELANGDDAEMKAMAQKIKSDQEKEIQELQAILNSYQADQPMIHEFHTEVMASMEKMGRESDLNVLTGDTDQDFAQLMIPHHQAALENSHSVIEHGNSPGMEAMAKKMIAAQMQEIKELQEWLLKNKKY